MEHPHPRLVRLLGYCIEGDTFCLVYEFMKGGSLQSLLNDPERLKKLTAKQRMQIAFDIGMKCIIVVFLLPFSANGLDFLHSQDIIHLDIKPDNILLDENNRAFIADCGSAKMDFDGLDFSFIGVHINDKIRKDTSNTTSFSHI